MGSSRGGGCVCCGVRSGCVVDVEQGPGRGWMVDVEEGPGRGWVVQDVEAQRSCCGVKSGCVVCSCVVDVEQGPGCRRVVNVEQGPGRGWVVRDVEAQRSCCGVRSGCVVDVEQGPGRGWVVQDVEAHRPGCEVRLTCALRNVTTNAPGLTSFAVATTSLLGYAGRGPWVLRRDVRVVGGRRVLDHNLHEYTLPCMFLHHRCGAPSRTVGCPRRNVCLVLPWSCTPT